MKFNQVLIAGAILMLTVSMNACSFLHRKSANAPMSSSQEFDPHTHTWKPATHVATVAPAEPNETLAQSAQAKKKENSVINKVGRAGSSVGNTLKKPFGWLPWNKKSDETAPQ